MENTIRFRGSLSEPQRTLNRPNIAPSIPKAKRRAKKRARAISLALGMVALFTFTFNKVHDWQMEQMELEKEQALDRAMENFVAYNPAMLKIEAIEIGEPKPTSEDTIIVEWNGIALGHDRLGEVKYSNDNPNYLIFDRESYSLEP